MEENSLTPKKNNVLKALPFLEIGVFEIAFVAVILFLLFGILNYFNILSISDVFPNQMGWLPRQSAGLSTKSAPQNFSAVPKTSPTPTGFQYDVKKAQTLLIQYLIDNIKPEFLPAKIEVKQGLSIDNITEDIKYQFGAYLSNNKETISANFHYKENTNIPNDFIIFIQPSKAGQKTLTSALANSLLSSYFINPYSPIEDCKTKGITSYCEIFKIENDGKRGFGVVIAQDPSKSPSNPTSIVFTCFIPKESKDYDKQISCISP